MDHGTTQFNPSSWWLGYKPHKAGEPLLEVSKSHTQTSHSWYNQIHVNGILKLLYHTWAFIPAL